jgi:hypothetical protein
VHSQNGEDGIISALLERLPTRDKWVVEFGAWDGVHLSNSRHFIADQGFSGVLIEGDPEKFTELSALYAERQDVITLNQFVGMSAEDNLDDILRKTPIPHDFDYLSIDIDGNDYYVWQAFTQYRPKVVCIEYNPTIPSDVDFVQEPDLAVKHGASVKSLVALGAAKGYQLAAVTLANAIFVAEEYYDLLEISDNSVHTLRTDTSWVTHVFSGYDGTLFVRGSGLLPWHDVPIRLAARQELPSTLRRFPADYDLRQKLIFHSWLGLRHPAKLRSIVGRRFGRHQDT